MKHLLTIIVVLMTVSAHCHNLNYDKLALHEWTVNADTKIHASFLMFKNDEVYLQNEHTQTVHFPLADFSKADQQYVVERYKKIQQQNLQGIATTANNHSENNSFANNFSIGNNFDYSKLLPVIGLLFSILFLTYFFGNQNKLKYISLFSLVAIGAVFYSFKTKSLLQQCLRLQVYACSRQIILMQLNLLSQSHNPL